MLFSKQALAFLGLLASSLAQFVSPPTDLIKTKGFLNIPVRYKEVPEGICELTPNVKSYSGYVDIAEQQHIFWWFFEARNEDPMKAPLTVWINGGPGSSSMLGLFQENGPCSVDSNGDIYYNPYSWKYVANQQNAARINLELIRREQQCVQYALHRSTSSSWLFILCASLRLYFFNRGYHRAS